MLKFHLTLYCSMCWKSSVCNLFHCSVLVMELRMFHNKVTISWTKTDCAVCVCVSHFLLHCPCFSDKYCVSKCCNYVVEWCLNLLLQKMTSEVPDKSWELSHYEINRKAQALISKKVTIAVSSKVCWTLFYEDYLQHHLYHQSVHSELRCPICLDLLTATMTTKECLHRFCAECIITALRSGRKKGL